MDAEVYAGSKDVWTRVKKIMFSPKLEAAMWKKFHVTRANMAHDFRLQIDTAGYSIGVHPDQTSKAGAYTRPLPSSTRAGLGH